jgi:hypothetical protein
MNNSGYWRLTSKNETEYITSKISHQGKIKTANRHRADFAGKNDTANSKEWQKKRYNTGEKS